MGEIIASNGYINIKSIDYGLNDYVVLEDNTKHRIHYGDKAYFRIGNTRYNLDEFIRNDI